MPPSSSNPPSSSPSPAPAPAPTRQNQNQNQSLTNHLSLAALASLRADKREARAREDQRATDARRAAALAERGLLPASRRYSVAALPTDEEDGQVPKAIDPFRSDGLGMRRERVSVEGIVVDVGGRTSDGSERGEKISEAEALIREWRERNARADSKNGTGVRSSELDAQSTLHEEASAAVTPTDDQTSSPVEPTTSLGATPVAKLTMSAPKPSSLTRVETAPPIDITKPDEGLTPLPTPPTKKATLKVDTREVSSTTHAGKEKEKTVHAGDASVKAKEKAALGAWRFPATSPISEKSVSEVSTPTGENDAYAKLAALVEDAASPPPLPPKSKKDSSRRAQPPSPPTSVPLPSSPISPTPSRKGKLLQSPPSPTQISLPVSPTSNVATSAGIQAQASSMITPSTSTSSQTAPASRTRLQAQRQHSLPSSNASLMPSLPALSPTTSTTSTSGGSALPRTPSTSSNGHSPVRVLDAPREDDEDALLMEHGESVTPTPGNTGFKHAGMKDVKLSAQNAKPDSEADELGALPPLPVGSPPTRGSSTLKVSDLGKERSVESDKRKRASLFGRRRTTQTSPVSLSSLFFQLACSFFPIDSPFDNFPPSSYFIWIESNDLIPPYVEITCYSLLAAAVGVESDATLSSLTAFKIPLLT